MADTPHPGPSPADPQTTGHAWDGIVEYNNPLPRWWLYTLYATIIWSVGYWIAYPAWPLVTGYTGGLLGYSQRGVVLDEVDAVRRARDARGQAQLATASVAEIRADPALLRLALATGKAAFGDNCAACHGSSATGRPGYPNLQDDDWLWGGTPEEIERTIRYGARSGHGEAHVGDMPAFGRDGVLKRDEIAAVATYVLCSPASRASRARASRRAARLRRQLRRLPRRGRQGESRDGRSRPHRRDLALTAPRPEQVVATITNGRRGMMPAWEGRLDPATIKALAVYVHDLGGGR
ncbi:cytochrome-c oxidase, cbb3-type subunit III [Methylobacterium oryzae CBMB20]